MLDIRYTNNIYCPSMGLWSWLTERGCGIFLHISSLPSHQGIGCFNHSARKFVEFLTNSGMKYWQICPLHPTSYGDSPYQSPSVFAGNPYFIDLSELEATHLLSREILDSLAKLPYSHTDFGKLYKSFWPILRLAFDNFAKRKDLSQNFEDYCDESSWWLEDYANFMAIKHKFNGASWLSWPSKFVDYENAKSEISNDAELRRSANFHKFTQWAFEKQWRSLKTFAKQHNISIIGDIPIFPGLDSADVWANKKAFKLNSDGSPKFVAGVPPDAFSKDGQLWGNPVYDWEILEKDNFSWWINRLQRCSELYDIIRLDHFRGFYDYWEIPAHATIGTNGKWKTAPGMKFFKHLRNSMPEIKLIAEDLGYLSEGAVQLLRDVGLPGMNVLHFAFDGNSKNKYLPHEHEKNSVLYIGTHDNDTTKGWYASASEETKHQIRSYLRTHGNCIAWDFIRKAYESTSNLVILTMQDILNLGSEARFNHPSTLNQNWQWRMTPEQAEMLVKNESDLYLKNLQIIYGR